MLWLVVGPMGELYGCRNVSKRLFETQMKLSGKKGTVTVDKYCLQRDDGKKPFASRKIVTLPENSPIRRFNLDRFELTREKVCGAGGPAFSAAPGLRKTLKLIDKDGRVVFTGVDSIRQFMKSIAHLICKL